MTNRRLIKQQIEDYEDDYARVFGEYSDAIDAYNALPQVVRVRRTSGRYVLSDGRQVDPAALPGVDITKDKIAPAKNGETYQAGTRTETFMVRDPETGGMREEQREVPNMLPVAGVRAEIPEPGEMRSKPSFTNKQIANYNNPQPTYAEAARNDGKSVMEKHTGIDDWRSGITTDKGILQRVLQGAYK